jgi:acetyl esterase/lipase
MSWLFLLLALTNAWLTYNMFRPIYQGPRKSVWSFFAGWLWGELALHMIAATIIGGTILAMFGALGAWPGKLGLVITVVSCAILARGYWRSGDAADAVEGALQRGLGLDYETEILPEMRERFDRRVSWAPIVRPFPIRNPDVEVIRDIRFGREKGTNLELDVYRHRSAPRDCPTLLQIHGGGWVIGDKREQGLPLINLLASHGWVCVNANYRLSPHATFPDHLIDVKRAIAWIREHGARYGANPDFIVATGGSAGGHLAALVGLTANDPEYQPGFEDVDTSVQAVVPFYGVYDFTNRHGTRLDDGLAELLETKVMKGSQEELPEEYAKASPVDRVREDAPPFCIIHGDRDTLAPVEDARLLAKLLRERSREAVVYAEVPGAQHAFELFPSLRSLAVINAVERFVSYAYSRWMATRSEQPADTRASRSGDRESVAVAAQAKSAPMPDASDAAISGDRSSENTASSAAGSRGANGAAPVEH